MVAWLTDCCTTEITSVAVKQKLGAGNYGEVYYGEWNGTGVALKKLKDDEVEEFKREAVLLL